MKVFVPDASVILKWVLGETENQDKAIELLEGWLNQEHEKKGTSGNPLIARVC